MGIGCACSHRLNSLQSQAADAVKQKPPTILVTTVDPCFPIEQIRLELQSYLEENKAYMNKSVLRMFQVAVESPEQGLATVKLKMCRMREVDWTHFSRLISCSRLVSKLFFWKLSLTSKGFSQLCSYLPSLCVLRHLAIGDVGLGYHNVQTLAEALRSLTSLTHLSLTVNCLRSEHIESLSGSLETLTSLSEISLDENEIGDEGCVALRRCITALSALTQLSVRYNAITYRGCVQLLKASKKRPQLKVLLEGNDIGEEDWSRMQAQDSLS